MSVVTNAILSWDICESTPEDKRLVEINRWFEGASYRGFVLCNDKSWYGGSKCLETPLAVGAFNHFDESGFLNYLATLDWDNIEAVQLIVKRQEEDTFSIVRMPERPVYQKWGTQ